jgi:hypothetical protein
MLKMDQYRRFVMRSADRATPDEQPTTYELEVFYLWAQRFQRCRSVVCPLLNPGNLYWLATKVSGIPADRLANGDDGNGFQGSEDHSATSAGHPG